MGPEFFQTQMGRRFYEATMPMIAENLKRLAKVNEGLLEKMESRLTPSEPQAAQAGENLSQFKDPYVNLEIPDTGLTVQVKLEGEGVVVDVFLTSSLNSEEPQSVASVWKLYDEMANPDLADDEETPE